MQTITLDAAGHHRSPATTPGYHQGRPPRNKGMRHPADPPTTEEIIAVMRAVGERPDGLRLRALIVLLWRAVASAKRSLRLISTARVVRSLSAVAYAEFGIGRVMPGRSLCRARPPVTVCWLRRGESVG